MTYDVDHLFIYLLAILISSSVRCLLKSLAHFFFFWPIFKPSCLCSYCWVLKVLYIFWITVLFQTVFWKACGLSFHSFGSVFHREELFNFNEGQLIFLSWIVPLMLHRKSHHQTQDHLYFLLCYLLRVSQFWDFPGRPVVKTLRFHCKGQGFDPWSGN